MDALDAAEKVLRQERRPMHYGEITDAILRRRLWATAGKTPAATVNSRLAVDIREKGSRSRFKRTDRGIFALRGTRSRTGLARVTSPGERSRQPARTLPKLTGSQIRSLAVDIVKAHPDGIRYGALLAAIVERSPDTPPNTVQGSVWDLDAKFPDRITKPVRGVFKYTPTPESDSEGPASQPDHPPVRLSEEDFYEPFADWLRNDLGEAIDASPLGGAALRLKWGTPDVIGVYKPRPSDRISFPKEIISAEIKADPREPVVAFGQAVAYRLFSARTYIVMPKTMPEEDLARLEALCMLFGIGLVLYSPVVSNPAFTIRVRAQRVPPDMYYVNQFADGLHKADRETFDRLFR